MKSAFAVRLWWPIVSKRLNTYFWITFLPAHIFFVIALINTTLNFKFFITTLILWTLIAGYGLGVGFHRLLSHNSFATWPIIEVIVSYLGCLAIQGSPIFWVNLHRGYHHKHADTEQDIQSPLRGKLWGYFLWTIMIQYKVLQFNSVNDLLRKTSQRILHYGYFVVVWLTWAVAFYVSQEFFFALIVAQIAALHQEFCVNLFCHSGKGYRNFDTPDNSINRHFFGLLFWGVGYHNNHHARPHSYSFAYAPHEFDPTTLLVKLIRKKESSDVL